MNRMIRAFIRKRWLTAVLLTAYFIPMVLFHKTVARWSLKIERAVTYSVYNLVWGVISLAALAAVLVFFAVRLARGVDRAFRAVFLAATFALIASSHILFLAVNLEYIHILQFSLVVFPLFALTGRFGETVFWTGLLGGVDELYQYYVAWWPHQSAFDFNDIMLDVVGGLFMATCLFLWLDPSTIRQAARLRHPDWKRSPALATAGAVVLLTLAADALGVLDFYPPKTQDGSISKSNALILLSKVPRADSFWSIFEDKKTYHILLAVEWTALLAGLAAFASLLDRRIRRQPKQGKLGNGARRGER